MLPTLQNLLSIFRPQPTPAPQSTTLAAPSHASGSCGTLVATDGRVLPLRDVTLRTEARGGVARVVLAQRFVNSYAEPLRVTYRMGLPAEAAVSGYSFLLDGRRVVGEVDKKRQARERFERALIEGKTAGIVEQERTSLFTQELGNVPGGAEIVAEITIDQRLLWRAEGAWEWRFPTTLGARYVGSPGAVADAARIEVATAAHGVPARLSLAMNVRDELCGAVESPSHALSAAKSDGALELRLADEGGAPLDRDVVVRWPVAVAEAQAGLSCARPEGKPHSYGLLTLVPPLPERQRPTRRDLILLLDTSGSMGGEPLAQLQKTSIALIETLTDDDTLEMIEFSSSPSRWSRRARTADARAKVDAIEWIERLSAGGGTEMVTGMMEALAPLTARSQRQVILMTDGYIGNEVDVVKQVTQKLPHGACRVHVVGVGSSVNRTLTRGVARAGGGVEVIIAPGEEPAGVITDLLARTALPLVTGLTISGPALVAHSPALLPDLYAGAPALVGLQLRPEGGQISLSGQTSSGKWQQSIEVPACADGQGQAALAALFAREAVEDLELAHLIAPHDKRGEIDAAIENLGLTFQISTRLTTWVAIGADATVDPSSPGRRETMPNHLPQGVSAAGLGLRSLTMAGSAPMARRAPLGGLRGRADLGVPAFESPPPAAPGGFADFDEEDGALSDLTEAVAQLPLGQPEEAQYPEIQRRKLSRLADLASPAAPKKERAEDRSHVAMPPPPAKPAQPGSAPLPLRARLLQQLGAELVFELDVLGTVAWKPGAEITLVLADGRSLRAAVQGASTRAGSYQLGQTLRLVVELHGSLSGTVVSLVVAGAKIPVVS